MVDNNATNFIILAQEVAIKQFREEGEEKEFLMELMILKFPNFLLNIDWNCRQLKHANVVTLLAANVSKRFLVLEFIVNGTLHDLLQSDHLISWPGLDFTNSFIF